MWVSSVIRLTDGKKWEQNFIHEWHTIKLYIKIEGQAQGLRWVQPSRAPAHLGGAPNWGRRRPQDGSGATLTLYRSADHEHLRPRKQGDRRAENKIGMLLDGDDGEPDSRDLEGIGVFGV